ncbi:MAG: hypothetical protein QM610_14200 [Chitinophagaceae bacterium]
MAKVQKAGNGKKTRDTEKIGAIRAAIIAGETARAIHEKLGTSIVNVHYHKNKLRKEGLLGDTPKSKPGRKPGTVVAKKAAPAKVVKAATTKPVKAAAPKKAPVVSTPPSVIAGKGPVSFVVNGTKVAIEKAKAVKVTKKAIVIEF